MPHRRSGSNNHAVSAGSLPGNVLSPSRFNGLESARADASNPKAFPSNLKPQPIIAVIEHLIVRVIEA